MRTKRPADLPVRSHATFLIYNCEMPRDTGRCQARRSDLASSSLLAKKRSGQQGERAGAAGLQAGGSDLLFPLFGTLWKMALPWHEPHLTRVSAL
jgi:hypothetical protein